MIFVVRHVCCESFLYMNVRQIFAMRSFCKFLVQVPCGGAENAELDITRLDNVAPYRKGGHRGTWQCGTISQRWTSWNLTLRHHIARVDNVEPDNAAPYRKGGQRETWKCGAWSNRGVRAKRSRVVVYGCLITAFTVFIILYASCTLIVCCFYSD